MARPRVAPRPVALDGLGSRRERYDAGRAVREAVPLSALADTGGTARDPLTTLRAQDAGRVPELVPIRWGRMSVSPFTFYRGAAAVMATDLAVTKHTGLDVQLCGDAHLSNFGVFAAPDRRLVFDLNDFDETAPGSFEWDVKRLAASIAVAGRSSGFDEKRCARAAASSAQGYRTAVDLATTLDPLDVWYFRVELDQLGKTGAGTAKSSTKEIAKARSTAGRKNRLGALAKLTEVVDGRRRIRERPPLIRRLPADQLESELHRLKAFFTWYLESVTADRRHLLLRYRVTDLALKVVGVGSVGTRCLIALLESGDDEPLLLQIKQAGPSVLEQFEAVRVPGQHGRRVVEGQQLVQSAVDVFLGWSHYAGRADTTDYYVRQLWDGKASATVEAMGPKALARYARLCGMVLARAHARSGDAIAISGYLGDDDSFDRAITTYAVEYARRNEHDHAIVLDAIASGELPVIRDL